MFSITNSKILFNNKINIKYEINLININFIHLSFLSLTNTSVNKVITT